MKVLGKLLVKGKFGKVIGGPRLAVEGVCCPQRQAYLACLPCSGTAGAASGKQGLGAHMVMGFRARQLVVS